MLDRDLPVRLGTLRTGEDKDAQEQAASWLMLYSCRMCSCGVGTLRHARVCVPVRVSADRCSQKGWDIRDAVLLLPSPSSGPPG